MQENHEPTKTFINGWAFRIKQTQENSINPPRMLILLHGHLGNENVMWALTNPISKDYYMLAPRAPLKLGKDQYSWHDITSTWPDLDHYSELTDELLSRISAWQADTGVAFEKYDLIGFSQGAVLAYALALLHPDKIGKVAALASFLPQSWQDQLAARSLKDIKFYISHGKRDQIVPFRKGREAAELLHEAGAQVTFCEADTGHKLSANCFKGLGKFFKD